MECPRDVLWSVINLPSGYRYGSPADSQQTRQCHSQPKMKCSFPRGLFDLGEFRAETPPPLRAICQPRRYQSLTPLLGPAQRLKVHMIDKPIPCPDTYDGQ